MRLLIDGDLALYRAAHACQHGIKYTPQGFIIDHADLEEGKHRLDHDIGRALRAYEADHYNVALTDLSLNWRHKILPTYKGNRKDPLLDEGGHHPLAYWDLREYLLDSYSATVWTGLEADDVLGLWATGKYKKNSIVLSYDKDLRTIPCTLATSFTTPLAEKITKESADRTHLIMALTGDRVDGYPGCPGLGVKRAPLIIDAAAFPWDAIVAEYEKAGMTEKDALRNARVARILRHGEYDHDTKEVKLWEPRTNSIVESE